MAHENEHNQIEQLHDILISLLHSDHYVPYSEYSDIIPTYKDTISYFNVLKDSDMLNAYCSNNSLNESDVLFTLDVYGTLQSSIDTANDAYIESRIELCNILGCEIDYLLGADDMEGFNHVKLASHYSGISEKIITHAIEDSNYQDCLNYFMHPDNCSKLVNHITLNAWKDFLSMHEFDSIADPLKSLIQDIFYQYQAFTSFSEYSLDSYKKFVVKSIPADSISFSPRKSDERINVNSCIPDTIIKDLALSSKNKNSYDAFIEYIAKCSYETLNTKALLDVKKKEMSNMFIKLFEDYLSSEEYVSQYSKEMEMIE